MKKILLLLFVISSFQITGESKSKYFENYYWKSFLKSKKCVKYPVIFVHGIADEEDAWHQTINLVSNKKYYRMRFIENNLIYHSYYGQKPYHWFWSISYYTPHPVKESFNGSVTLYAQRLEKMINIIKSITGKNKVIIIAHSMGGLIAKKYMVNSKYNWNSVYKILTVGTPNEGVPISTKAVGQLRELQKGSKFLVELNSLWPKFYKHQTDKKWGVVGGLYRANPNKEKSINYTDAGGPGFIQLKSAIPLGESLDSIGVDFGKAKYNTKNFGFRIAVKSDHNGLKFCEGTLAGIEWAMQKKL